MTRTAGTEPGMWPQVAGFAGVFAVVVATASVVGIRVTVGAGRHVVEAFGPLGFAVMAAPLLGIAWALGRTARPSFQRVPLEPPELDMVEVPGGSFEMGSDEFEGERPVHVVRVSPFTMARTPTTKAQWRALLGEGAASKLPKTRVSWHHAVRFCNALSTRHGYAPCYDEGGACHPERDGYRLPTEAEWEYACRAGTTTRWWWGDDEAGAAAHAWFAANTKARAEEVGARGHTNPYGLSDMAGNVWEWVGDWFGAYPAQGVDNPTGPESGTGRVLRGGSWTFEPVDLRSANRISFDPSFSHSFIGFRCVRVPRPEL